MPLTLSILAAALPGFVRLGPLRLPVFGMFATAGLIAALLLSQRTARLAGLEPDRLWDAGIVAVAGAFLASRLLLIAVNLRVFLSHPLLVLAQPSLTLAGLCATAVLVFFWLRCKCLPLLPVLDAWAAPGALLAAILQLGHFAEGTDTGMPTALPWSVHNAGDPTFARVHPVQLYLAATYLALCGYLGRRLAKPYAAGATFGVGLLLGGGLAFFASFLRQPYDPFGQGWLDPAQYGALLSVAVGFVAWRAVPRPSTGRTSLRPLRAAMPGEEQR